MLLPIVLHMVVPLCHDLANQPSHYLYFFSIYISFLYYTGRCVGKYHITNVIQSQLCDGKVTRSHHMMGVGK